MPTERQPLRIPASSNMSDIDTVPPWFIRYITIICRVWGVVTLIVMWITGVWTLDEYYNKGHQTEQWLFIGWYLVAIGLFIAFIEVTWIIDKLTCCRREGCCCALWKIIMWLDSWKRGILYILLSIPSFLEGLGLFLSLICGFMLIILGCLYITKTFRYGGYTVIREVNNTQIVSSTVSQPKVVTLEVTTQTDDDQYYEGLFDKMQGDAHNGLLMK